MFSLHETTRIRLCRAAFFALCLVPTCAVLGWTAFVNAPAYRRAHQRAIATRLGWRTELSAVTSPRPGTLLYEGLELSDPATGQALARLPFVEIDLSGEVVVVKLPYPAIVNGTRLDAFWNLIDELAQQWPESTALRFEAQNLTVHLREGDQSFTDVVGQFDSDGSQTRAKLTFRRAISGAQAAEPCLLTFTLRRDAPPIDRVIQLATGSTPLPAALFSSVWSGATHLGSACQFNGRITAMRQSGNWQTKLEGRAAGIDLDLLVSRQFPHKLTGLADAQLKNVKLSAGRIETAQGSITAGPGVISRSLVQSAETHLHIRAAAEAIRGRTNLIPYKQLSAGFEIDEQGMSLRGQIPGIKGALLVDSRHVLAVEPPLVSQPVVDLVRTLVPHSEVHVPATRETASLTGTLPVPSIVLRPGSEVPLPHARPVSVHSGQGRDTILR